MAEQKSGIIADIFENLSYGPAPEGIEGVQDWLKKHDFSFGHFIDGKWIKPENRSTLDSKNPCTGSVLAVTLQGTDQDVDLAVNAAKTAYKTWSELSNHIRARYLYSLARHLQKHQRLLSVLESLDNGKPIRESRDCDIPNVIRHVYHHAGWAQLKDFELSNWKSLGVVAAIVPWNFPLMLLAWKVCPALAMGNTVVLKPSSYTRLSALLFAEICAEAGIPPGVINIVTGDGELGSILAKHPDVAKVAFTGSTEVGKKLRQLTAGTGKKISLELGGKSPIIVFDSADIDSSIEGVVDAIWFNQGQVCSAGSRLLVQESIAEQYIAKLKERMSHLRLGDSLDKSIDIGAIIDEKQRVLIEEYVARARVEGAEVFQTANPLPDKGCYYPPTLITNVFPVSEIVIDEVFGPVLVVITFRTAKEAISLANNTIYGLASSIWTENITLALEVAYEIKAGTVWINSHNIFDASSGFGGYKQSGFGRDGGKEGLYEYVKPQWQAASEVPFVEVNYKKFGSATTLQPIPNSVLNERSISDFQCPEIDRTYKLYYGGAQKRPDGGYSVPVFNPKNIKIAQVAVGNRKDIRNAVECAQKVQPRWEKRSGHNRAQILYFIAENLEVRRNEFVKVLMDSCGKDEPNSSLEVDVAIQRLFHWAAYCDKYRGTIQETTTYGTVFKLYEAMGVIGIACPDVYPLLTFVSLFAPAIALGNSVVIIPSQTYPLPALSLYQVFETSDLPGVVNIITGERDHLCKFLTEHQDVQAMWYFGTAEGSKFVEWASSENLKRTWVNYDENRDWMDHNQGQGEEFLYHVTQCKNIWIPMGDIFAN